MMKLLAPTGWPRVFAVTIAGTLFCIGAALYVDSFNFPHLSPEALQWAILTDIFLPLVLAGTMLFALMFQMRRLAIVQEELQKLACTDSLTTVLNRGAFTMLVEAYLEKAAKQADLRSGAMLVIDADHFKAVNDQLGHDSGDKALKLIAHSIRDCLREGDIVGRLGGEEFGVFLPGAHPSQCEGIAERIRQAIAGLQFSPKNGHWPLSVSVGGVTFADRSNFEKLYSEADACLYEAKRAGRNRVLIRSLLGAKLEIGLPPGLNGATA
jgi:diguanylate cyclase